MLGREVEEGQQYVEVVGDLRCGLGVLGKLGGEDAGGVDGVGTAVGIPDRPQQLLGARMQPLGQGRQNVGGAVHPAALDGGW